MRPRHPPLRLGCLPLILSIVLLAGCTGGSPAPEQQGQAGQDQGQAQAGQDLSNLVVTRSVPNITVTLALSYEGMEFNSTLQVPSGTSAFAMLEEHVPISYSNTSEGPEISMINGVAQNSTHSWAFYVNGAPSEVGVADYPLKSGDVAEFRLEPNG